MTAKMRHCFYCGMALGVYAEYDPLDHCGQMECARAAQDEARRERDEAHEKLDRDRGWN
jgi:hypothetical protein